MTLRLTARPSGLLVPLTDFGLKGVQPTDIILGDDIGYVASLLLGHDGNQPRLLQVDQNRNLLVSIPANVTPNENLTQWGGAAVAAAASAADAMVNSVLVPRAVAYSMGFNNANWDRLRTAAAAILNNKSGLGVLQATGPGEWVANSAPAAGVAASASQAAGAAGVRHIGQSITLTISSQAALAAVATVTLNIRDGATGAGAILEQYNFDLPAAIVAPFALVLTDLNLVGTAATAMTAELAAAVAGLRASVTLRGYDAS